jgi:NAD(P)-dependent dehydrogenase (short-subunit alcohol dehydrogenase family)
MLAGKRALVTGSIQGIGRAAAEELRWQGAELVGGAITDRAAVERVARDAGEVDVLVHAAGARRRARIEDVTHEGWAATVDLDLTVPWLLTRALLGGLRRRRGAVLFLATDGAVLGFPGGAVHCATQGGIVGLTRALAVELAPEVRVLCVCHGPVEEGADTPARGSRESAVPMRRAARPEEVARLLAFAASDAAGFATGAVWTIDGGITVGRLA